MSSRIDEYFVLREGATQEEQWTWDEIADRCRRGEFTGDTRVFLSDESRWVRVGDTDLQAEFDALMADGAEEDSGVRAAQEELESEYDAAVLRLEESPGSVERRVEVASLAFELGRVDEAREHFERALERHPFHPRVAQEVKRRFSRAEWRGFALLERPEAVWDNLGDVVTYPIARGWVYPVLPAALFAALQFISGGGIVIAELALLWCYRCSRAVAAGKAEPVEWNRALVDPVRNLLLPGATMAVVFAEWLLVFWGLAHLGIAVEHKADIGVLAYIAGSPVLTVALTLCALSYLPAVIVRFEATPRGVLRSVNPLAVVRGVVTMRAEYALSLALLFALAVIAGILGALTGSVPIVGKLVWAAATTLVMLASALILGRLRARVAHLFAD